MLLCSLYVTTLQGQEVIPVTGGNATGGGGSVSYTVGQITYLTLSGTNGTVAQGVQQPYEISILTAIRHTEDIILECLVFPNPARGKVKLVVRTKEFENLKFQLFEMNGVRLQENMIENEETEITMDGLLSSIYILKVLYGNKEIKTFKIIKN